VAVIMGLLKWSSAGVETLQNSQRYLTNIACVRAKITCVIKLWGMVSLR
jgi:hypothetical protein